MDRATEVKLIEEAGAEMRARHVPITPRRVEHFLRERAAPTAEEIDAALKDTGCVAIQNVETGAVAVFMPPVLYTNLEPDELKALKAEQKTLQAVVSDMTVPVIERMRATQRLRDVTVLIERHEAARTRFRPLLGT